MLRDALLVAGKDLRIEWRTRVTVTQVAPFALLILVLFAFALDPRRSVLVTATPGLFWVTILLSLLLAVQRSFAVEVAPGLADRMRLSGLDPAGVFLGKMAGILAELLALEVLLLVGVAVLYSTQLHTFVLIAAAGVAAALGLAASGTLYGALVAGVRGRETLLPLLLLPVVSPVLIAATSAFEAAFGNGDVTQAEGWRWVGLLAVFALVYVGAGIFAFGPLLEES